MRLDLCERGVEGGGGKICGGKESLEDLSAVEGVVAQAKLKSDQVGDGGGRPSRGRDTSPGTLQCGGRVRILLLKKINCEGFP